MKRLIPILILSALMLTGCNSGDSSSSRGTSSEITTADTTDTTLAKYKTTATTTTAIADIDLPVTITVKQNSSSIEPTNGNSPELPLFDGETETQPSAVTTQAATQATEVIATTKATEKPVETTSATLPKSDEPIELPIIPIG